MVFDGAIFGMGAPSRRAQQKTRHEGGQQKAPPKRGLGAV